MNRAVKQHRERKVFCIIKPPHILYSFLSLIDTTLHLPTPHIPYPHCIQRNNDKHKTHKNEYPPPNIINKKQFLMTIFCWHSKHLRKRLCDINVIKILQKKAPGVLESKDQAESLSEVGAVRATRKRSLSVVHWQFAIEVFGTRCVCSRSKAGASL